MVLLVEGYFIQLRCFFGHCLQGHNYGCFFCYQVHSFESQVCVHFSYFSVYWCHLTLAACVCQLTCASLQRRGCFVNVMSLAALVLLRPNKTGSQAEPSLCELWSRRALSAKVLSLTLGLVSQPVWRDLPCGNNWWRCLVLKLLQWVSAEVAVKLCSVVCQCWWNTKDNIILLVNKKVLDKLFKMLPKNCPSLYFPLKDVWVLLMPGSAFTAQWQNSQDSCHFCLLDV